MGTRPNEWDVSVSLGLCSELRSGFGRPDPADYLDGFASGAYPTRLEAAQRLRGSARIRALAALDLALMRNVAPRS